MIDRKAIKIGEQVDRLVSATAPALVEGCVLCEVVENGVAKVTVVASPAGTEKIAGFAILPYQLPAMANGSEEFTVPSSGSLVFNLRLQNLVSGSILAKVVGGSPLTPDESNFSATPSTGVVKVNLTQGQVKFAAGNAGAMVQIVYKASLSVTQARMMFQERSINNRDLVGDLQQVGVAKGYVEISTDQFDTSLDWSNIPSSSAIVLGANGLLSFGNPSGKVVIPQAKVLAVPDLSGSVQGPLLKISALIG
jgi:hypothetical protein